MDSTRTLPIEVIADSRTSAPRTGIAQPCAVVIFGATGDLTRRKLMPALYQLRAAGELTDQQPVVGFARRPQGHDEFRTELRASTARFVGDLDESTWQRFARGVHYVPGNFDDAQSYRGLAQALAELDRTHGTRGNRLYYLATPPASYPAILQEMRRAGLVHAPSSDREQPWSRVIIEKPIGHDLESARALNGLIGEVLAESQTYRIDHYLGKETVQNILVLRFGNAIFEPLWNRKYIDHVQITMAESIGVEGRGSFFDANGVLRDVVQNHLLQILALIAMEPPPSFRPDDIRDAKVQLVRSLRPLLGPEVLHNTVRAQYDGYRGQDGVGANSRTPTYVAMKMNIDNWRWQGVPFYLRAGKGLDRRVTEVAIQFQDVPLCLLGDDQACQLVDPNVLVLRIQPDEGIALRFVSKVPGDTVRVSNVHMDMSYQQTFGGRCADAYERLLLDALRGDPTLFARRDEVEEAWRYCTPILEAWSADTDTPLARYASGTRGPAEADQMLARHDHVWRQSG